jgi:glycosyltransferase involved in cell wall biosynthesis
VDLLRADPGKITVIYSGVSRAFAPVGEEERERFRAQRVGGRPFILHVGTLQPRKNVDVLIRAFAGARRAVGLPHMLVLIGARGWMFENLFRMVDAEGLRNHVLFADYVPPDELPLWYNASDLFAYPSAYEGFGLPVLEAMACGVPVVTSTASSLREVAGAAGCFVPPGSQEALQMAIVRVLGDRTFREGMIERGLNRAGEFTWERTAAETAAVYESVAGEAWN